MLIFDEVITGFRVSLAGAQGKYGVRPDLSIFGKAVANGLPMSVIAGREDLFALIASGKVGHGGTYNSLPPAIAAGVATLGVLERIMATSIGSMQRDRISTDGAVFARGRRRLACRSYVQGDPAVFFVGFPIDAGKAT